MDTLKLTKEQENKFVRLPIKQAIYVPSTHSVSEQISCDELTKRVDEVSNFLANLFGGYAVYDLIGGYVIHKKDENMLIKEHFVRVVSFAARDAFHENQPKLFKQIAAWAKEWGQTSIGYEYEEDLLYIPQ